MTCYEDVCCKEMTSVSLARRTAWEKRESQYLFEECARVPNSPLLLCSSSSPPPHPAANSDLSPFPKPLQAQTQLMAGSSANGRPIPRGTSPDSLLL